jgi:tetratricopeptide (TPR) repeat protein
VACIPADCCDSFFFTPWVWCPQVIKNDSGNAEAYGIRGMALFLSADYDQALKHLKEGLRLDPDSR